MRRNSGASAFAAATITIAAAGEIALWPGADGRFRKADGSDDGEQRVHVFGRVPASGHSVRYSGTRDTRTDATSMEAPGDQTLTAAAQAGSPSGEVLARYRILLVQDDDVIVSHLARSFAMRGAAVVEPAAFVADGTTLLAATRDVDAAVLDINLRGEMALSLPDAPAARGIPFVFAKRHERAMVPSR